MQDSILESTYYLCVETKTAFNLCYSEPDCGMASWEAQKYFKQLISGVVSAFLVMSFLLQVIIYMSSVTVTKDTHHVLPKI
jgi:hypothetical protein